MDSHDFQFDDLADILSRVCDGLATAEELEMLAKAALRDEGVRLAYMEAMASHAAVEQRVRREMTVDSGTGAPSRVDMSLVFDSESPQAKPDAMAAPSEIFRRGTEWIARAIEWHLHPVRFIAVIATLTFTMWAVWLAIVAPRERSVAKDRPGESSIHNPHRQTVARLTRVIDPDWGTQFDKPFPGMFLKAGRTLQLQAGLAELTFDDGAQVVLEGPVEFRVDGPNAGWLVEGQIVGQVPERAKGFLVGSSDLTVIDLGTEFGMLVSTNGPSEVQVFDGKVKVRPADQGVVPLTLKAGQAVTLAGAGEQVVLGTANPDRFVRRLKPARRPLAQARIANVSLIATADFETASANNQSGIGLNGNAGWARISGEGAVVRRGSRTPGFPDNFAYLAHRPGAPMLPDAGYRRAIGATLPAAATSPLLRLSFVVRRSGTAAHWGLMNSTAGEVGPTFGIHQDRWMIREADSGKVIHAADGPWSKQVGYYVQLDIDLLAYQGDGAGSLSTRSLAANDRLIRVPGLQNVNLGILDMDHGASDVTTWDSFYLRLSGPGAMADTLKISRLDLSSPDLGAIDKQPAKRLPKN